MACAPNSLVKWSDIHDLALEIDDLAAHLSVPDYVKLVDSPDMPFKFEDLVSFSGALRFEVLGGLQVTNQHLTDGVGLTAVHALDTVLDEMGKIGDLFLRVEPDECWCKTLFEVDTTTDDPVVKEVTDPLGCCQSLFVPQIGDSLDYDQNIIPAGHALHYSIRGNPSDELQWTLKYACVAATTQAGFRFQSSQLEAPLTDCTREIESAKFTWPIRSKHFQEMWDKILYILQCEHNGGATNDSTWNDTFGGCSPYICEVLETLHDINVIQDDPGCIHEICGGAKPWLYGTCGGEECDENTKIYCKTLEEMHTLVAELRTGLIPYSGAPGGAGCCCEYNVGTSTTLECQSWAEACTNPFFGAYNQEGIDASCIKAWEVKWKCQDEDNDCQVTETCEYVEPIVVSALTILEDDGECEKIFDEEGCGDPSGDDCFSTYEWVSFEVEPSTVTYAALRSAAVGALAHVNGGGACTSPYPVSHLRYYGSPEFDCPWQVEASVEYYTLSLSGPDCPGETSISVMVDIVMLVRSIDSNSWVEAGRERVKKVLPHVGGGEYSAVFGFPEAVMPGGADGIRYYVDTISPSPRIPCKYC